MKQFFQKIAGSGLWNFVWAVFIMLLPLTSVPAIVRLVHSDVVAAPSGVLLPLMLIMWGLPLILSGKRISENAFPLILFFFSALFATLVSFFYTIPDYKGRSPVGSSITAVLTLIIGMSYYLSSLLRHDDEKKLQFTFRFLNISGALVCIWTLLQAFFWYKDQRYPEWMKNIQFFLSIGSLYRQRFVGFTLEPSWLAHQLNLLYLPFWFASSITGYSAFSFRRGFFTVERVLFVIGAGVLFLTLSRVGLAAFLITVGFASIVFLRRLIAALSRKFPREKRALLTLLFSLGMILLLSCTAFGILFLLSKLDFRMKELFSIRLEGRSDPLFYLAEKLSLAARFVYWDAGFSVFDSHPLLGVGLGHAGFYMPQFLSDQAYRLIEVQNLLFRSETLLNIKSMWVRIPAETGIVGFIFFIIWYLHSLLDNMVSLKKSGTVNRTAAWMGCFALLAFLLEGFSLDTFALPYLWFSAGLSAGAKESGLSE